MKLGNSSFFLALFVIFIVLKKISTESGFDGDDQAEQEGIETLPDFLNFMNDIFKYL